MMSPDDPLVFTLAWDDIAPTSLPEDARQPGGEAFRVNFALRLALARLLAQRSGRALQLLIIDEGFGTQDQQGCDRLVAAINAIAADFACILTVTHIPHFRAAFPTRIDVVKTAQGSQLALSS